MKIEIMNNIRSMRFEIIILYNNSNIFNASSISLFEYRSDKRLSISANDLYFSQYKWHNSYKHESK